MSAMAKKRKTKRTTRPKGKHKRAKVTPCDVAGCTSKAGSKCQHCHACMCEGHVAAGYVCCSATGGEGANPKGPALFACQECGRKFYTVKSAQAAQSSGCPKCGGSDIDEYALERSAERSRRYAASHPGTKKAKKPKLPPEVAAAEARLKRASERYHSDLDVGQLAGGYAREYEAAIANRHAVIRAAAERFGHESETWIDRCRHCGETPESGGLFAQCVRTPAAVPDPQHEAMLGTAATHAVASMGGLLLDRAALRRLQAEARAFGHTLVDDEQSCRRCRQSLQTALNSGTCAGTAAEQSARRQTEAATFTMSYGGTRVGEFTVPGQPSAGDVARALGHDPVITGEAGSRMGRAGRCLRCGAAGYEVFNEGCPGPAVTLHAQRMVELAQETARERRQQLAASEAMLGTASTPAVASVGGILLDRAARGRLQAEARAFGHVFVDDGRNCARCGQSASEAIEGTCVGSARSRAGRLSLNQQTSAGFRSMAETQGHQVSMRDATDLSNGIDGAACFNCAMRGPSLSNHRCPAATTEVFPVAAPAWAPPPPPVAALAGTGVERLAGSIAAERIVAPSRATPEWVGRMSAQPEAIAERAAAEAARLQRAAEFRARGARPAGVPAPRSYVPAPGGAERFRGLEFDPGAPVQHDPATEAGAERFRGLELWNPPRAVRRNGPTFDRPGYPFADKQAMYADMDTGSLQWSWADAIMARDASMGWNAVGETWYQDDASTIGDELRRRGAALGEEHLRAMKNREWRAQQAALAERYAKEQHAAAYAAPGAERFKGLELDRPRAYGEGAGGAERFRGLELSNPGDADLRALEREILSGHAYGMPQDHEQIERLNDMRQRYGLGRWDRARITQHQSPKYKSKWKGDHDWTTKAKALASVTRPRLFADAILVDEIAYAPGSWDTVLLKRYLVANDRAGAEAAQRAHMAAFEKLSPSDKIARMTMNNPFFAPPALQYVAFANPPGDEDGWR